MGTAMAHMTYVFFFQMEKLTYFFHKCEHVLSLLFTSTAFTGDMLGTYVVAQIIKQPIIAANTYIIHSNQVCI